MASTSVSKVVTASPDRVWKLIGGFHSLPDWLPYIPDSTPIEGGRARRLHNSDGEVIIERIQGFSDVERYYSYAIVQAPFPVTGYLSFLRVYEMPGQDDAAEVEWSGRFVPQGVSDQEVIDLFTGIFSDGLDALSKTLAG